MFENLDAARSTSALFEILFMLGVAGLLGYFLAWSFYRRQFAKLEKRINSFHFASSATPTVDLTPLRASLGELDLKIDAIGSDLQRIDEHNQEQDIRIMALRSTPKTPAKSAVKKSKPMKAATSAGSPRTSIVQSLSIKGIKADAAKKDDLKQIKGVGPFIEKKVNALGIYTFEQISKLTRDDVKKVTEAIEFFPGRIQRDGWVRQASKLIK